MSSPHIEVVPRIIDSSIAAAYQTPSKDTTDSKKEVQPQVSDSTVQPTVVPAIVSVVPRTFTEKFFSTLKDYLIPIVFIIAVIVIIYILWTYWTKYRVKSDVVPVVTDSTKQNDTNNQPEDLSKYILDTDDNSDTNSITGKLSVIEEGSEPHTSNDNDSIPSLESVQDDEENDVQDDEDDENDVQDDEDDENDENEEENDVSDVESLISEPDFSVISNLINQPISEYANDRFEYLNDEGMSLTGTPEDDAISVANSIHTEIDTDETHMNEPLESVIKNTKRTKKPKRMVL
jgi:hypothetical protein